MSSPDIDHPVAYIQNMLGTEPVYNPRFFIEGVGVFSFVPVNVSSYSWQVSMDELLHKYQNLNDHT